MHNVYRFARARILTRGICRSSAASEAIHRTYIDVGFRPSGNAREQSDVRGLQSWIMTRVEGKFERRAVRCIAVADSERNRRWRESCRIQECIFTCMCQCVRIEQLEMLHADDVVYGYF